MRNLRNRVSVIAGLVIFMWIVELFNMTMGHQLSTYGIMPRDPSSLPGILFAPFLHGSIAHAAANTVPLMVLGVFVAIQAGSSLGEVLLVIATVGGFGVWLFGRPAYHVGASGMIMGFFGFLVASTLYKRSLLSVVVAFLALLLYGSSMVGVIPGIPELSWEMHLFGFVAGVLAAWLAYSKK